MGVAILASQGCDENASSPAFEAGREPVVGLRPAAPATGPLKVHPTNPRFFADGDGKAIYLTGSHHWNNLVDSGPIGQSLRIFDYDEYLDFLTAHNHNFMRMWSLEGGELDEYVGQVPYLRTGPGTALDGKLKFDLDRFDPDFFERLRSRVVSAGERGIYVAIMLFNGWSIQDLGHGNPWPQHPFNRANNINGLNGDANGNGEGEEVQTLLVPAVTERQQHYVRKVIDTVNDLDNVLFEISNESAVESKDWQYHLVRFIHRHETRKPKQHPVGMTSFSNGETPETRCMLDALLSGPAEWISPCSHLAANYAWNPPPATGEKVVLSDTDHFFGVGGDHNWVWKSFTRGLNPIYMDPLGSGTYGYEDPNGAPGARIAMGETRSYAQTVNLATMAPHTEMCSTSYCLASPGEEYIVYLPFGSHWVESWVESLPSRRPFRRLKRWIKSLNAFARTVTVDLQPGSKRFHVEWLSLSSGRTSVDLMTGQGRYDFTAPFKGDTVLHLTAL